MARFRSRRSTPLCPLRSTTLRLVTSIATASRMWLLPTAATNQVDILLSNGDGTFLPGAVYSVGKYPLSVAVADLRRSGNLDLAVGTLAGGVNVLLGNGDGTFQRAAGISVKSVDSNHFVDFNGDGMPDLAVSQYQFPPGISVMNGNGDGTFQSPTYYPTGVANDFVASGDFNGDHQIDLLACPLLRNRDRGDDCAAQHRDCNALADNASHLSISLVNVISPRKASV